MADFVDRLKVFRRCEDLVMRDDTCAAKDAAIDVVAEYIGNTEYVQLQIFADVLSPKGYEHSYEMILKLLSAAQSGCSKEMLIELENANGTAKFNFIYGCCNSGWKIAVSKDGVHLGSLTVEQLEALDSMLASKAFKEGYLNTNAQNKIFDCISRPDFDTDKREMLQKVMRNSGRVYEESIIRGLEAIANGKSYKEALGIVKKHDDMIRRYDG